MKFFVLTTCICIVAAAYPPIQPPRVTHSPVPSPVKSSGSDVDAPVLRSDIDVKPDGYDYAYETGNGISASAVGTLKNVDNIDALVSQGSYQYVAPDGTPVNVQYVADENGYQPNSDILPTPPPIPPAIARALEYLAAHPPLEEKLPTKYHL
ncbi:larval cuticle protein LCP-17-like [Achroia grisella]|uniref:larval cuticle protein LCP-17-like n=1 Tax=Achroia grisella TaxID=688607 RepID=UPI0027D26EB5|nr:larval cuticle protein LCP-17-like [Achroia grisella]